MKYCYLSAAAALIIAAVEYWTGTTYANAVTFWAPFAVLVAGTVAGIFNH